MHVADITMFYAPQSGGVKRYLHAKRSWLASRAGFRHTLLVPGPARTWPTRGVVALPGVRLPGPAGYRLPLGGWAARRALRRLRPDVIEAGDPFLYANAALSAGQETGAAVIAFCHSDVATLARAWLPGPAAAPLRSYLRWLYARFDLVLAASGVVERTLRDLGLHNVARQPLGVDTALFHPGLRDLGLRARLGVPADTHLLVFAGRYAPEKNLWVLEQAMQRLDRRFLLLTIGSGAHAPRGRNVVHLPYQPEPAALARLLASCDALVHPGDRETFGLVVVEAMACGLPVIGSDRGGISELVDAEVGITVPPLQPDALHAAILRLFAGDRTELARRARARARARHDWNAVMPGLIAHYDAARLARAGHAAPNAGLGPLGKPG